MFKRKPIRWAIVAVFLVPVLVLTLYLWEPLWLFHRYELKIADRFITRVEAYRASHGYLPETIEETGISDPEEKVFYLKRTESAYEIWWRVLRRGVGDP